VAVSDDERVRSVWMTRCDWDVLLEGMEWKTVKDLAKVPTTREPFHKVIEAFKLYLSEVCSYLKTGVLTIRRQILEGVKYVLLFYIILLILVMEIGKRHSMPLKRKVQGMNMQKWVDDSSAFACVLWTMKNYIGHCDILLLETRKDGSTALTGLLEMMKGLFLRKNGLQLFIKLSNHV